MSTMTTAGDRNCTWSPAKACWTAARKPTPDSFDETLSRSTWPRTRTVALSTRPLSVMRMSSSVGAAGARSASQLSVAALNCSLRSAVMSSARLLPVDDA